MSDLNQPQGNNVNVPEVKQELSKVATSPKRNMLIGFVMLLGLGYGIYSLFFANAPQTKALLPAPAVVIKPAAASDIPAIPKLPDPPKLKEPTLPPVPIVEPKPLPLPTPLPNSAKPTEHDAALPNVNIAADEAKKRQEAKRKSKIVLLAGKEEAIKAEKSAESADLKETGELDLVLGQGKIIDAVLESAINTDLSTEIRAIITHDIYSQSDKVILIPKGSRAFGTFSSSSNDAYGRINISWNKINLANGYTLNIQGIGVDNIGRKGNQGRVDNKYKEQIANTILLSTLNVITAKQIDKLVPPVATTQTADANTAASQQLGNIALAIYNNSAITSAQKYQQICAAVANAIPDKTSTSYTTFIAACNTLNLAVGSTDDQKLSSVMASVNTASSSLLLATAASQSTSHAQDAANTAVTDVGNTLKNIISQEQFKRTVTIDQGTPVKIYVSKDYIFPKTIINKRKLLP